MNYREAYGMYAVNGILFNHESPRRGENFVTRKITRGVADIVHGRATQLGLGNLDARRDWGFAGDYVQAMWLMLQQPAPDDFVIATGEQHSVADFCAAAFRQVDLDYRDYVVIDKRYLRPAEVETLCGDASKAAAQLGWRPDDHLRRTGRDDGGRRPRPLSADAVAAVARPEISRTSPPGTCPARVRSSRSRRIRARSGARTASPSRLPAGRR